MDCVPRHFDRYRLLNAVTFDWIIKFDIRKIHSHSHTHSSRGRRLITRTKYFYLKILCAVVVSSTVMAKPIVGIQWKSVYLCASRLLVNNKFSYEIHLNTNSVCVRVLCCVQHYWYLLYALASTSPWAHSSSWTVLHTQNSRYSNKLHLHHSVAASMAMGAVYRRRQHRQSAL